MKAGKKLFSIHHWCGLIAGFFLLIMSTSGAFMAFWGYVEENDKEEMVMADNPSGQFFIDSSLTQIRQQYPGWEIRLYDQPAVNEALTYELRDHEKSKKIFVHPVHGQRIQTIEDANDAERLLLLLHYSMLAGTAGKLIVFSVGILFLITLITGLYVYRRSIWKVLQFKISIPRRPARKFYSSLHRVLGVWSLLFNLLIVSTGLVLSFKIVSNALKPAETKKVSKQYNYIPSADAALKAIHAKYPDFEIHLVRIKPYFNEVQLSGNFSNDPAVYGHFGSRFIVDGSNAEIKQTQLMKDMPFGKRLQIICGPLHFGNYGGLPVYILYAIFGITPAILSITGFFVWRKRSRQSRLNT